MKYVAIVTSTQYGQTTKIAERIREILHARGFDAHLFSMQDKRDLTTAPAERFDAVVIGAPVYAGRFPKTLCRWTLESVDTLNRVPCAFFSVSLNAADTRERARKEDLRLIDKFITDTGLRPKLTVSLIGALHYREYGFLKRWLMKKISASAGGPTDTSRNHELTDWDAVRRFAEAFAELLEPAPSAPNAGAQPRATLH
ncbi:MAG: flavodoxin domain-containing protein [Fimbriimonas sp.]